MGSEKTAEGNADGSAEIADGSAGNAGIAGSD